MLIITKFEDLVRTNKMFSKSVFLYIIVLIHTVAEGKFASAETIADKECQKIIKALKGYDPVKAKYVIGGENAYIGEFPHMVALGFENQFGFTFDCGGSLVSNRYVLTAAHCVDRLEPKIVRTGVVKLGNNSFNVDTDVPIESIIKHPGYTPSTRKYDDLALIKLEKDVEFNSERHAICLYTNDTDPTTPLTVTGWGTTSTTEQIRSDILLKADVSVVSIERCNDSYPVTRWRKLPEGILPSQICAGDSEGLHDSCQGDSGGPLQGWTELDSHIRLVGVTSFGRGCGSPAPAVYTRASRYRDWIERIVWPQ